MNKYIAAALFALASCLFLTGCDQRSGETKTADASRSTAGATRTAPAADNTANNSVDRSMTTKTPLDQSESTPDVKITAEIRRALMADKALSTNAKNCKVITDAGVVTLRGVVDNVSEKDSVQAKAEACAGVIRVDNQLDVKNT